MPDPLPHRPRRAFWKSMVRLALGPALALVPGLPAATTSDSQPVRIGLLLPPEEFEADSLRQGAEIAVAWANRTTPGSVELLIRGRPGQWGDDGVEAGRLVLDDAVVGLIAPPGGMPTHLALQVAGRTATPVVSLCPDHSVTGAGVPWSVRIVPTTQDEARSLMTHFSATHSRWAALVPEDRAGREIGRDLAAAAAAARCALDPLIRVKPLAADPFRLPPEWREPWPDGLLIWLEAEPAAQALRALRAAGFRGTLAGPGRLLTERFRQSAGGALDGFTVAHPVAVPAARTLAAQFETDYRNAYGQPPDLTGAMACDAVSLLLRLRAQSKPGALYRQFPISDTWPGVTGLLQFDRQGNRVLPLEPRRFEAGQWITF